MQPNSPDQYYRSLKQFLLQQNYKQIEDLLNPKLIPQNLTPFLLEKSEADRSMPENHRKIIQLAENLARINQAKPDSIIPLYEEALTKARDSSLINDEFEFQGFFRVLFKNFRKDISRHHLISEDRLKSSISIVREVFVAQKKSKFFRVLPIILHELMFLYFVINQYQQCSKMLETITSILPDILNNAQRLETFNINYYLARLDHFRGDSESVEERLEISLKTAFNNKQRKRILSLLIPIKISRKQYPTNCLCSAFNLPEFARLSKCVKLGDLSGFEAILEQNTSAWIKSGTLFILNQCKSVLLSNLLRRVHGWMGSPVQIGLKVVEKAFNFRRKEAFKKSEIVSIVSGLIYQGHLNCIVYAESYVLHFNPKKKAFN